MFIYVYRNIYTKLWTNIHTDEYVNAYRYICIHANTWYTQKSNVVEDPSTARNPPTGLYDTQQFRKAFISQPEEFEYYIGK